LKFFRRRPCVGEEIGKRCSAVAEHPAAFLRVPNPAFARIDAREKKLLDMMLDDAVPVQEGKRR